MRRIVDLDEDTAPTMMERQQMPKTRAKQNEPRERDPGAIEERQDRPVVKPFRFGFLVHDVSRMRRTLFDDAMRPLGVTRSQWYLLATLSRVGGHGMMQVDLARHMEVGKVTIGGLIDRLEASGFVERRLDSDDRRARRIFITEKGYGVITEMQKAGNKLNKSILSGVSAEDLRITEETLARIKTNIRNMMKTDAD